MSIADKIAKIIAKADSTTNPKEAEVFMAKAQQLMEEYGFTLLDLGRLDSDDPVGTTRDSAHHFKADNWARHVAYSLGSYYGAKVYTTTYGNKIVHSVVGRESARVTYSIMIHFVLRQVRAMARKAFKDGVYASESRARTAIGNALSRRLWILSNEQKARREDSGAGSGLNALVPVDLIKQECEASFPDASLLSFKGTTDTYAVGEAEKIAINRQTEVDRKNRIASQ
jgi:hypothetical protein